MGLSISNIFSINLNYINYETVCMLLILPIMFLILCSDDTVEEIGGSNHVLFERYLQEVINISMDNPEIFASFNKTSVTRSSELLKDSVWSSGNGHTLIYETN